MAQAAQTIILDAGERSAPIVGEVLATAAVKPGHLVDGGAPHAAAGQSAQKTFALEKLPVAGTIDTDYVIGETLRYGTFHSGHKVNAIVNTGVAAIVAGAPVGSDGAGGVQTIVDPAPEAAATPLNSIVGYALEAVDNSAGAGPVRIQISIA